MTVPYAPQHQDNEDTLCAGAPETTATTAPVTQHQTHHIEQEEEVVSFTQLNSIRESQSNDDDAQEIAAAAASASLEALIQEQRSSQHGQHTAVGSGHAGKRKSDRSQTGSGSAKKAKRSSKSASQKVCSCKTDVDIPHD